MVRMVREETCYVTQKTFDDISSNQTKLIDILNHRITALSNDVIWIKRIGLYMAGILSALTIGILSKALIG